MTPEAVKANWTKICDFDNATKPKSIQGKEVSSGLPGESEAIFQKVFGPIVEQWHGREGPHNS